jgi:hypothetical protein
MGGYSRIVSRREETPLQIALWSGEARWRAPRHFKWTKDGRYIVFSFGALILAPSSSFIVAASSWLSAAEDDDDFSGFFFFAIS